VPRETDNLESANAEEGGFLGGKTGAQPSFSA
jgi:hypothetical protein